MWSRESELDRNNLNKAYKKVEKTYRRCIMEAGSKKDNSARMPVRTVRVSTGKESTLNMSKHLNPQQENSLERNFLYSSTIEQYIIDFFEFVAYNKDG